MSMRDLYLVTSLTELMTVSAVLRERGEKPAGPAILHGQSTALPPSLCDAVERDAGLFGDWTSVHVLKAEEGVRPRQAGEHLADQIKAIVGANEVSRIFLHALHKPIERRIVAAFPDAAIHLFDNGLSSHVAHPVLAPKPGRTKARWIDRAQLRRVVESWYTVRRDLAAPEHIPPHLVRDLSSISLMDAAGPAVEHIGRANSGSPKRDVIIGTAFYRTGRIEFDAERQAHLDLVAELKAAGGPKPWFKPHPRTADQPVLTEADGVDIIDSHLPLEAWAAARPVGRAFSLSSTALLTLRRLFGVEAWRFGVKAMAPVTKGLPHIRLIEAATPEWRGESQTEQKIIGVGLAKTGTKTLNACFDILGYKRRAGFQPDALKAYASTGSTERAEAVLASRQTCVDWPWPLLFEEMDAAFPGSKFVLTRRESAERWVDSVCAQALKKPDSPYREMAYGFADPAAHREALKARYEAHLDRVRSYFADRPDDLLEICFEEGDGWEKLCPFLGKPRPEEPVPHENRTPDMIRARVQAAQTGPIDGKPGKYSLLQRLHQGERSNAPFPHLVVENCLPAKRYAALRDSFPLELADPGIAKADNKRHDLFASWGKSRNDPADAPQPWRAFMRQNSRPAVANAVWALFRDEISAGRDRLYETVSDASELKVRVTVGVNTPARREGVVRGPHCDNRTKAFVGLYYLRDPDEGEAGGDLLLYRWKPGCERRREWAPQIDEDAVEIAARIPYSGNKLVLFPNFDNALHGVSARAPSTHWRKLVVISGWFPSHFEDARSRASLALGPSDGTEQD